PNASATGRCRAGAASGCVLESKIDELQLHGRSKRMSLWRITVVASDRNVLRGGEVRLPGRLKVVAVGRPTGGGDDPWQRVILVDGQRADADVVVEAFTALPDVAVGVEPAPDGSYLGTAGAEVEVRDGEARALRRQARASSDQSEAD